MWGIQKKLNLDRSSGNDSMEEDVLESKQVESKYRSDDLGDGGEKIEVSDVNEGGHVDFVGDDISADKKDVDDKDRPFAAAEKRKLNGEFCSHSFLNYFISHDFIELIKYICIYILNNC